MQELVESQVPDFSGAAFQIFPSKILLPLFGVMAQLNLAVVTDKRLEPEAGDLVLVGSGIAVVLNAGSDGVTVLDLQGIEFQASRTAVQVVVGLLCPAAFSSPRVASVEGIAADLTVSQKSDFSSVKRVGFLPYESESGKTTRVVVTEKGE